MTARIRRQYRKQTHERRSSYGHSTAETPPVNRWSKTDPRTKKQTGKKRGESLTEEQESHIFVLESVKNLGS